MNIIRKLLQSPFAAFLFISILVFFVIIGLRSTGSLESLEFAAYDWFIRLKPEVSRADPRIVIIGISEKDIRNQGRWPLTDNTLAQALSILARCKPRAIGLDIFRDIPVPPGNEKLNSILSRNRHIIGVMKFGDNEVPPPPVLKDTDRIGFNDILVDPGGIVRRALLFMDDGATVFSSFALKLALMYLQGEGMVPQSDPYNPQYLKLGETTIRPFEPNDGGYVRADARGYQFLLGFDDVVGSFPNFSLTSLLSGRVDLEAIKDRVVLIGVEAQSVKDLFFTPFSRGFQGDQAISGVSLHALIVSELVRFALDEGSPIKTANERQEAFWILLWCMMGGVMGLRVRSPWRFSVYGFGGAVILGLIACLALLKGWWIPVVPPAMAWLVSAAIVTAHMSNQEKKQRAILMQLFSKHVSPEVAEQIWRQREQFLDGRRPRSQKLVATVFFSDLKGFTSASESMDPQSLIDWLNTYMEPMTQLVMQHGGVIDDYAGDGIKANFGIPLPRKTNAEISQDAVNAVNCALAMEKEIERLNVICQERHLPAVGIRIGIFTGSAVAGAVGSSQRLKYTTVGDTVNVAARLESYDKDLAKDSPCRILIGENTLQYLNNQFMTKRIGQVSLKGKDEKISIHRVIGRTGESFNNKS